MTHESLDEKIFANFETLINIISNEEEFLADNFEFPHLFDIITQNKDISEKLMKIFLKIYAQKENRSSQLFCLALDFFLASQKLLSQEIYNQFVGYILENDIHQFFNNNMITKKWISCACTIIDKNKIFIDHIRIMENFDYLFETKEDIYTLQVLFRGFGSLLRKGFKSNILIKCSNYLKSCNMDLIEKPKYIMLCEFLIRDGLISLIDPSPPRLDPWFLDSLFIKYQGSYCESYILAIVNSNYYRKLPSFHNKIRSVSVFIGQISHRLAFRLLECLLPLKNKQKLEGIFELLDYRKKSFVFEHGKIEDIPKVILSVEYSSIVNKLTEYLLDFPEILKFFVSYIKTVLSFTNHQLSCFGALSCLNNISRVMAKLEQVKPLDEDLYLKILEHVKETALHNGLDRSPRTRELICNLLKTTSARESLRNEFDTSVVHIITLLPNNIGNNLSLALYDDFQKLSSILSLEPFPKIRAFLDQKVEQSMDPTLDTISQYFLISNDCDFFIKNISYVKKALSMSSNIVRSMDETYFGLVERVLTIIMQAPVFSHIIDDGLDHLIMLFGEIIAVLRLGLSNSCFVNFLEWITTNSLWMHSEAASRINILESLIDIHNHVENLSTKLLILDILSRTQINLGITPENSFHVTNTFNWSHLPAPVEALKIDLYTYHARAKEHAQKLSTISTLDYLIHIARHPIKVDCT